MGLTQPSAFLLRDVRCFRGEQTTHLRPITLLVGENSTGKTTYLGCYDVMHRLFSAFRSRGVDRLDFNREPFSMGSFRDIVRSQRGRAGRIDEFALGFGIRPPRGPTPPHVVRVFFSEKGSEPIVSSVFYEFEKHSFLRLTRKSSEKTTFETTGFKTTIDYPLDENWMFILDYLSHDFGENVRKMEDTQDVFNYLNKLLSPNGNRKRVPRSWSQSFPPLIPVAPLRSKPKRTYDPIREITSPEGEHVPMLLMRLERTDKSGWDTLHDDLVSFGRTSGLFTDIALKRPQGRQMSDPFQLQFKVRSGSRANVMDVGYGVSQSLPILVDVNRAKESTFLMQQPEVHLHPRAQAELSGLLLNSFKKNGNRFLIETHSDYIIDRVRILTRKKILSPEDVSILYFAPKGSEVEVHNINLDDNGNLQDVPPGYREFFIRESDMLLGFRD